jgi:hypothetical protein
VKSLFSLLGLSIALTLLLTSAVCFAATAPLYGAGNVLAVASFNDGPGSSDMTCILRLSGDSEIYIDEGSPVKYVPDPGNQDEGDGWIQVNYNDSGWEDGVSGVGFADGDDNTALGSGLMSIWIRYYFEAPNAASISDLTLLADYDDQCIVWLNGVRIFASSGAPDGDPPAWNASEGGTDNHGSTEMAAGTPNEARWTQGSIEETAVDFVFAGATAVEASDKLAVTWGSLKK